MADESRPASRRLRREAQERAQTAKPGGKAPVGRASPGAGGGRSPEVESGFGYTEDVSTSEVAAAFAELEPEASPEEQEQALSRKERRRLERLENPMETWTAEEEARHTGQVPSMTPEAIARQEEAARQRAAAVQQEAIAATGGTPKVSRVSMRTARQSAAQAGGQSPQFGGQGMPQQAGAPGQPQVVPPGGARPVPMPVGQAGGAPGIPQSPYNQAMNFEALVAGGVGPGGAVPSQVKPPTTAVPQVGGAFQSPGVVQAPMPPPAFDPSQTTGPYAPPGQMIVPGTGTLQATSGTLRTIPGTGAIPRPMVEIHPAGGVRHFGWPQLLLLAAAAFALGVVIWNVAASGN